MPETAADSKPLWPTAMPTDRELLERVYARFNARDIDAVLAVMHPEIAWPNGWEGGYVHGHDGVRDYWTRLWNALDPRVEPLGFATAGTSRTVVEVHQVVRDLQGRVVSNGRVMHVYSIDGGLILGMDIVDPGSPVT